MGYVVVRARESENGLNVSTVIAAISRTSDTVAFFSNYVSIKCLIYFPNPLQMPVTPFSFSI